MKLNKNKKYLFVVSDIHSFAAELKNGLRKAGFNKKNPNHTLIVCGDIFDRGDGTMEVYKYLSSIPKSRCILIKGNHEDLYNALLDKDFPQRHDFSNCTTETLCHIAGVDPEVLHAYYWLERQEDLFEKDFEERDRILTDLLNGAWNSIKEDVKNSKITAWLNSDQWHDYYETDKFIFVHSFIPLEAEDELLAQYGKGSYSYVKNWRKLGPESWESARWGCPWKLYKLGLFDEEAAKNKVLVCGHWHTSDFFENLKNAYGHDGEIYFSKNLIGIDGGVHYSWFGGYSHDQNVLVIDEDGVCYDKYGNKLEEINEVPVIETVSVGE